MGKKIVLVALAMALVLGMVGMASAAQNVANTNQKGSLLIWPKIANADGYSTLITIGNDYYDEVWVKCYWVDADQQIEDFMFRLTPNQPVWFRASDGTGGVMTVPPFNGDNGELKCWAVNDAGDTQIAFNHLYGSAVIFEGVTTGFEYNAWSFTAKVATQGAAVGTGGNLLLTGLPGGYDACPQYLVENFMAYVENTAAEREPYVALVPCKQDLRQDRTPTCTKAKFDVWNENETKYTGAYRCIKCWFEGELNEIGVYVSGNGYGFGSDKFTLAGLHTFLARFRVTGVASPVCTGKILGCAGVTQVNTPLLGVLYHDVRFDGAPEFMIGTTPHTAGADGTGFVLWDAAGGSPEAPAAN
jgi:hypothetical protein